jgi:regulation of enolase protein 1 (concanavalin A-like superfamily)
MYQPRSVASFAVAATLALMTSLTAFAAPPPGPWVVQDIGDPGAKGSTDVDATGIWTLRGSGADISNNADGFQYAYQSINGDASITARFLSRQGGDSSWSKTGLMIRENDTPGSPCVNFTMTPGHGLNATARFEPDGATGTFWEVGPGRSPQKDLFMRLQRVGNEIAGFYSRDGRVWTQAGFSPQPLPTLKATGLLGLAVTSHQDGKLTTGQFDQVQVQPGIVSVYGIRACGGDRAILLQWRPLPSAAGFNVYRGPVGAAADQLVKLNRPPIAGTSFTDTADGLVNGTPVTYVVAPVFKGPEGQAVEGPPVAVVATPVAVPPGWMGCSIDESFRSGSVAVDPATGEITVSGSGSDIWDAGDQFYFVSQPVEGDVQITVTAITGPTATSEWAKAGLMIRESLDGSARDAYLMLTPSHGLAFQYRASAHGDADWPGASAIEAADLKTPITLRLTRKGNTITPEYSTDQGKSFQPAGEPLTFDQDLPRTLSVGLAITSVDITQISRATFKDLEVKKL